MHSYTNLEKTTHTHTIVKNQKNYKTGYETCKESVYHLVLVSVVAKRACLCFFTSCLPAVFKFDPIEHISQRWLMHLQVDE